MIAALLACGGAPAGSPPHRAPPFAGPAPAADTGDSAPTPATTPSACLPWPPAPPEPSTGRPCAGLRTDPCEPWETCFTEVGACRRPCWAGCPPDELCEELTWTTTGGTGHGSSGTSQACEPTGEPFEDGPRGFGAWARVADAPDRAEALSVAGGWLAVTSEERPFGFLAALGADGTLGPPIDLDRRMARGALVEAHGELRLWGADGDAFGSARVHADGTLGPTVPADSPPTWARFSAIDGLLVGTGYGLLHSARLHPGGALGAWRSGVLPDDAAQGRVSAHAGRLWYSSVSLWEAPLDALPNPYLAWSVVPDTEIVPGAVVGCDAIVVVTGGFRGMAARGGPAPDGRASDWRWSTAAGPTATEVRAFAWVDERLWVLANDGLWTLPRTP